MNIVKRFVLWLLDDRGGLGGNGGNVIVRGKRGIAIPGKGGKGPRGRGKDGRVIRK